MDFYKLLPNENKNIFINFLLNDWEYRRFGPNEIRMDL